jgi:hypothetical protein
MTMTPRLRKLVLTGHVTASVGWLGAVVCFLALALAAFTSPDAQRLRAVTLAMDLTCRAVLVPLSLASLVTGLAQSLGTRWGLFRHYWIVVKLAMNVFATIILLIYSTSLAQLAGVAAQAPSANVDLGGLRSPSSVIHAGGALVLLFVAVTLSVYKPRGLTRYGARKRREEQRPTS